MRQEFQVAGGDLLLQEDEDSPGCVYLSKLASNGTFETSTRFRLDEPSLLRVCEFTGLPVEALDAVVDEALENRANLWLDGAPTKADWRDAFALVADHGRTWTFIRCSDEGCPDKSIDFPERFVHVPTILRLARRFKVGVDIDGGDWAVDQGVPDEVDMSVNDPFEEFNGSLMYPDESGGIQVVIPTQGAHYPEGWFRVRNGVMQAS